MLGFFVATSALFLLPVSVLFLLKERREAHQDNRPIKYLDSLSRLTCPKTGLLKDASRSSRVRRVLTLNSL